jgi:uncharacterized protein
MSQAISDLQVLLRSMEPVLNAGAFAYVSVPLSTDVALIPHIAMVREAEGITLVMMEEFAMQLKLPVLFRCAWITLHVHSDLQAVGLTAAFAQALGQAGISCNVVAGAFHDHIFVPIERAQPAMDALRQLQQASG